VAVQYQRQMVDSRRIGAIVSRLIAGISAREVVRFARRHIGARAYQLGSSTVLSAGLYTREQSSTLYTVVTASGAVEVGYC